MKYLVSFDTEVIAANQAKEWGVDRVLTLGDDITHDLTKLPDDNDSLIFFIPTVLDISNSLSYQGATLALRILMNYIRKNRTDIDIVLLGNETEAGFLLHYSYPNILKIPGMYYARFNKKVVASYILPNRKRIAKIEYKTYLDNLGLKIPSSFRSTHSLTNDWCLFKWNSFMGYGGNDSSLIGHLYFEYLITIENMVKIKEKKISDYLKNRLNGVSSTRILIIDDNIEWHAFFEKMFVDNINVDVQCLGENFNKLELLDINRLIEDKIHEFNPHIIILDFRLMEDKDAEIKDDMKQVSGYKILTETIKGNYNHPLHSFGRQVLIFTATSRIENILMLREGNADGFILKEKPENYNGKEITKQIISKMISTIETAINRAYFLIPLNEKLRELETLNVSSISGLKATMNTVLESVRLITQTNSLNEGTLKLTYLDVFSILESLKPSHIKYLNSYVQENAPNEILRYWNNIDEVRNTLAHGDKEVKIDGKKRQVSVEIIQEWQIKLCDFIKEFIAHQLNNHK